MKKLTLIGAGQKYDLITIRGLEALKTADVVLYDRLVDSALLDGLSCELVDVGKSPYKHGVRQEYINELIQKYLNEFDNVVRLKGGDSTVFSRGAEEIEIAEKMNAEVQIIPGVTAASSAVARIKANLTDRRHSSGVLFLTGHKSGEELETGFDWKAIAALNMTMAIYMGVKSLPKIAGLLIENGMDSATPVLIAEGVESSSERIFKTTLSNVSKVCADNNIGYPAVTVVGKALGQFAD